MGGVCSVARLEELRRNSKFYSEILKGRDNLRNLGIEGRINKKSTLRIQGVRL
jgi:hypothetical protein